METTVCPPGLMHLPRPERARGECDREEEDDRAPQALLMLVSVSDECLLRYLRRDLRSPPAPWFLGWPLPRTWINFSWKHLHFSAMGIWTSLVEVDLRPMPPACVSWDHTYRAAHVTRWDRMGARGQGHQPRLALGMQLPYHPRTPVFK